MYNYRITGRGDCGWARKHTAVNYTAVADCTVNTVDSRKHYAYNSAPILSGNILPLADRHVLHYLLPPRRDTQLTTVSIIYLICRVLIQRTVKFNAIIAHLLINITSVSYTHLTLPTNREV